MSGAHRHDFERGGRSAAADRARAAGAGAAGAPVGSPEVTAAVVLLAGIGAAALAGPAIAGAGGELLRLFFGRVADAAGGGGLGGLLPAALGYTARMAGPLVAAGLAGAVAGLLIQNAAPITWQSVAPRWRRIAPRWTRLGRRLWSGEAAFNVGRELLKVGALAAIAVLNIGAALRALAAAGPGAAPPAAVAFDAALRIAVQAALALALLAAADYLFRFSRERGRRQRSPAEARAERRLQEGDPLVRERLRARMRALLTRTAADQVAGADVVIADAARAAVAVRWDRLTMTAPVVVAKAAAGAVQQMRTQAEAGGVAVVDRAALAGSLWNAVALGDAIPPAYQPALAAILAARRAPDRSARGGGQAGAVPWRR